MFSRNFRYFWGGRNTLPSRRVANFLFRHSPPPLSPLKNFCSFRFISLSPFNGSATTLRVLNMNHAAYFPYWLNSGGQSTVTWRHSPWLQVSLFPSPLPLCLSVCHCLGLWLASLSSTFLGNNQVKKEKGGVGGWEAECTASTCSAARIAAGKVKQWVGSSIFKLQFYPVPAAIDICLVPFRSRY